MILLYTKLTPDLHLIRVVLEIGSTPRHLMPSRRARQEVGHELLARQEVGHELLAHGPQDRTG